MELIEKLSRKAGLLFTLAVLGSLEQLTLPALEYFFKMHFAFHISGFAGRTLI